MSAKEYKTASAIGYDPRDSGPRLLARGRDGGAERIIALAREAGVQVLRDPPLAALLDAGGQVGDIIPVWCWEAAARILAFVAARNPGDGSPKAVSPQGTADSAGSTGR
jgi:type III secretion system FlhB-like substrate exporter